jgi:hypothetical protein
LGALEVYARLGHSVLGFWFQRGEKGGRTWNWSCTVFISRRKRGVVARRIKRGEGAESIYTRPRATSAAAHAPFFFPVLDVFLPLLLPDKPLYAYEDVLFSRKEGR